MKIEQTIKFLESAKQRLERFDDSWLGAEDRRNLTKLLRELTQGDMKFIRQDENRKANLHWHSPKMFRPDVIIYTVGNKMKVCTDGLEGTLEGLYEAQMEMAANAY